MKTLLKILKSKFACFGFLGLGLGVLVSVMLYSFPRDADGTAQIMYALLNILSLPAFIILSLCICLGFRWEHVFDLIYITVIFQFVIMGAITGVFFDTKRRLNVQKAKRHEKWSIVLETLKSKCVVLGFLGACFGIINAIIVYSTISGADENVFSMAVYYVFMTLSSPAYFVTELCVGTRVFDYLHIAIVMQFASIGAITGACLDIKKHYDRE